MKKNDILDEEIQQEEKRTDLWPSLKLTLIFNLITFFLTVSEVNNNLLFIFFNYSQLLLSLGVLKMSIVKYFDEGFDKGVKDYLITLVAILIASLNLWLVFQGHFIISW